MNLLNRIKQKLFKPGIKVMFPSGPYPTTLPDRLTRQQCIDCGGYVDEERMRCLLRIEKKEDNIEKVVLYDVADIIGEKI